MVVGVGDIEEAATRRAERHPRDAKRMLETGGVTYAVAITEIEEVAAGQRPHPTFAGDAGRDSADGADLAVGHIQALAVGGKSARLGEGGIGRGTVRAALRAAAGVDRDGFVGGIVDPDLVQPFHRNEAPTTEKAEVPR